MWLEHLAEANFEEMTDVVGDQVPGSPAPAPGAGADPGARAPTVSSLTSLMHFDPDDPERPPMSRCAPSWEGTADGDLLRLFNDCGSCINQLTPSRPIAAKTHRMAPDSCLIEVEPWRDESGAKE